MEDRVRNGPFRRGRNRDFEKHRQRKTRPRAFETRFLESKRIVLYVVSSQVSGFMEVTFHLLSLSCHSLRIFHQACLLPSNQKVDQDVVFTDLFDLPEQDVLRRYNDTF